MSCIIINYGCSETSKHFIAHNNNTNIIVCKPVFNSYFKSTEIISSDFQYVCKPHHTLMTKPKCPGNNVGLNMIWLQKFNEVKKR